MLATFRRKKAEIEKKDFNLNISRYISTAVNETEIVLDKTHQELVELVNAIAAKDRHNAFLRELDLKAVAIVSHTGPPAQASASACAKKAAACCCTKRYTVFCSRRQRS